MRKSIVTQLTKLRTQCEKHEEAIERNFSPKQVAIIKTRLGMEGGSFLYAKDTAKKIGVSESYVNQVMAELKSFLKTVPSKPRATRRVRVESKEETKPVEVLLVKGKANLKTGEVEVECADETKVEDIKNALLTVINITRQHQLPAAITVAAKEAERKASNAFFAATLAGIVGVVALLVGIKYSNIAGSPDWMTVSPLIVSVLSALYGLKKFNSGVSLNGERRGLLKVREL